MTAGLLRETPLVGGSVPVSAAQTKLLAAMAELREKKKKVRRTDGACMTSAACENASRTCMALTSTAADFAVEGMRKLNL